MTMQKCLACGGLMQVWFERFGFKYVHCTVCASAVTNPIPSERQIKAYYRAKFKTGNYLLLRQFADQYKRVYQQFVDVVELRLKEEGDKISGKKILDVGCFTGEFLELMEAKGALGYGTELQTDAVKIAQIKFPKRIIVADINTKNFPKLKFDIVTCLGLIEHVTDPVALMASAHKILKPGGLLVIQTPDAGSALAKLLGSLWPPLVPLEHIHVFSAEGLKLFLAASGFTDIRIEPHVKPLPVAYVYRQFSTFGHHFGKMLKPFGWILSDLPPAITLPFYGGEMIVTAVKK